MPIVVSGSCIPAVPVMSARGVFTRFESGRPFPKARKSLLKAVVLGAAVLCLAVPVLAQQSNTGPRVWQTPVAGDVLKGQALYTARCTACHAVDSNKTGPAHRGVMGRRVGSLKGYKYSDEMAQSRLRWTPQTLNAWLQDPEDLVAGQRMGFQVEDAQERADLIAYLATLK
ncbi:MAG TPA: c-type cytochrome [Polaromonas sp.]|uniref:c-type cytochrome n=1 Tax=Polaromonas sp. TaxID=1869339 RepID=UPI002D6C83B6|nr:c-type cytochrome [Polaromonas sp.]HYW56686.1 c-type cytochrome [Polaromonas sp.]